MKSKLLILVLGSLILFSDCNPFKNLGKTKQERKDERKSKRARKLVNKAVRIDPSILHPDTILVPGTHIDSSFSIRDSINFVDSIIARIIYTLDDRGNNSTGYSGIDREALRKWAIMTLKDSIRTRDLIRDTITHKFLRNGVVYVFKIWDHNGRIFYDLDQGEKIILDADVIIKELNFWERLSWWIKGLFWIIIILIVIKIIWWKIKQLLGGK